MTRLLIPDANAVFVVWGPPSHGPRSRVFARALGIDVAFVEATRRRGAWAAIYKYPVQAVKTVALLIRRRPQVVFVQSPPTPAVMVVAGYCVVAGGRFVVDAHSDAMLSTFWTRPRWLYRLLARWAAATIVTNDHFAEEIRHRGGRAVVLRDIPTRFPAGRFEASGGFNVMVVNTFAADEPLEAVVEAARTHPEATFHVTGDPRRRNRSYPADPPANLRFTGFLPDDQYYGLMSASQAVMCLTTRDHTMQRGACEALSMGRPIITSRWPLLVDYFNKGTVHVDNTPEGIGAGVEEMMRHLPRYESAIVELQSEQRQEWEKALRSLADVLTEGGDMSFETAGRGGS